MVPTTAFASCSPSEAGEASARLARSPMRTVTSGSTGGAAGEPGGLTRRRRRPATATVGGAARSRRAHGMTRRGGERARALVMSRDSE